MTDYTELKRLAEAAISSGAELSDLQIDTQRAYTAEFSLIRLYEAATPALVLALIAENEALRQSITDINSALEREYWSEYAGLDETRAILDAAVSKEPQP